jgi:hypothetical protein
MLTEDEVSPVACPRVRDHNCHAILGAVVRICAPDLLVIANKFSVNKKLSSIVLHHCYLQNDITYLPGSKHHSIPHSCRDLLTQKHRHS